MPCRYNKRRVWAHRILLEARLHDRNAFVTLTYSDENLPEDGSVSIVDMQLFFKRLRRKVEPYKIRHFYVGEYGDETWRPHYHAAVFGLPSCGYGQSRYSKRTLDCCYWCDLVRDTWGKGHVYLGSLEADSAQYMAGYVTKKMTAADDMRLNGRAPEFARMSLRPGIGADAMHEVASVLMEFGLEQGADVPQALRHGSSEKPLGRYLRQRLRLYVGKEAKISQEAWNELCEEMFALRMAAREDKENPSAKAHLMARDKGKIASFEARSKLFKKEKRL